MLQHLKNIVQQGNTNLAFCIRNQSYSYADLLFYVNGIRKMLRDDCPEAHFIGLAGYDDIETYASILALWAEGYAFVPLSTGSPKERNDEILRQVETDYVLSSRSDTESLLSAAKVAVTKDQQSDSELNFDLSKWEADQMMCMIFTSGSTGVPKGVPYTFKNIDCTLDAFFSLGYELSHDDRFLQMFELTFDMSMLSYLPAWCIGASVFPIDHRQVKYLGAYQVMQEHEITFAAMVPSTLQFLKPYFAQVKLPALRYCLLGGEPLYVQLATAWMKAVPHTQVVNISGPCETTMACVGYNLDSDISKNKSHRGVLAFGYPWKNTKVLIVDEQNNEVKSGEEGELCFAGNNVMEGYWQMPDKNAGLFFEKIIEVKKYRFYKSGDLAFQDEEGTLYSCGRKDQQYKIQGYKVELGDIEQHARALLKKQNVAATVIKNEKGILEIHLFVEGNEIDSEPIQEYLKQRLPVYMLPKEIHEIDSLPLTVSGKLDRKRLVDLIN